ncbi:MAG: hypothetical protein F4Y49_02990 [Dehalococcoidia bacterium]|nr:hypothetical protein [Dehalococcoidia bacterium]
MKRRIYADYKGERVFGEIDTDRILDEARGSVGFGDCVRLLNPVSSWMTATGAAKEATGRSDEDGWQFWRLSDTGERIIVLLRRTA